MFLSYAKSGGRSFTNTQAEQTEDRFGFIHAKSSTVWRYGHVVAISMKLSAGLDNKTTAVCIIERHIIDRNKKIVVE